MNTAPITSWDGAEVYYTFADKPAVVGFLILAGVAACVYTIFRMAAHEMHMAKKHG
ncbi:hypothetical protein [Frigidibacter oleivorans]|uniref:hypothetical protein n=1 Tax=Frigidibacter oleivorans TaxID=2487129 RepID=UPI0013DFA795|nr:hypothetical protein [Frigidibacter oleivorans]